MKSNPWKKQTGKQVFENPWISLHEEKVINPGGGTSHYGRIHYKNYAIGIIPLDQDHNTWIVGQWRYPLNAYSWEIPMGGGHLEVDRLESARRELKEETGLTATKWTEIIKIHLSNSVTDEVGYAFLAEDLEQGDTEFEETEDLEIRKLPLREAIHMSRVGDITDSLSVAALMKLAWQLGY